MIGLIQHFLAMWLTSILDPVLLLCSINCIQDSFIFAQIIRQFDLPPSAFLCSFDISSLFTNVYLAETIFVMTLFIAVTLELRLFRVKFLLNLCKQRQNLLNSVSKTLCPALANIFVGYYESLLF